MGAKAGTFLRLLQTFLYALAFCCAAIILGIYSYFLAVLANRDLNIAAWKAAVEGIAGAAVLYLIFAVLLTCFLGGVSFFAIIAIILDICFVGGFIAIAVMTRHGANSCSGNVNTPLGSGSSNVNSPFDLSLACKLNTTAFAVSIIAIVLLLLAAIVQIMLLRNHKAEKNAEKAEKADSGKRRFWQRKPKTTNDEELGTVAPVVAAPPVVRPSHDTAYTGSTVAAPNTMGNYKETDTTATPPMPHNHSALTEEHGGDYAHPRGTGVNPFVTDTTSTAPMVHSHHAHEHGGYYTQPQGTDVNPYGYDNTRTTGTNF